MLKRQGILASIGLFLLIFISIVFIYTSENNSDTQLYQQQQQQPQSAIVPETPILENGKIIMNAMGNETERYAQRIFLFFNIYILIIFMNFRAELGRATWKVFTYKFKLCCNIYIHIYLLIFLFLL